MTTSGRCRHIVLNHVESGALVDAEPQSALRGQLQRMKAAYADLGAAVQSHGDRGGRPARALDGTQGRGVGYDVPRRFQPAALSELVVEEDGLAISRPSLHRILIAAPVTWRRVRGDCFGTNAGATATQSRDASEARHQPARPTGRAGTVPESGRCLGDAGPSPSTHHQALTAVAYSNA